MGIKKTIGRRIARIREEKGLTQEKLACLTGLTPNTISLIETGGVYAKLDSLYKISKALNTKLADLFKSY